MPVAKTPKTANSTTNVDRKTVKGPGGKGGGGGGKGGPDSAKVDESQKLILDDDEASEDPDPNSIFGKIPLEELVAREVPKLTEEIRADAQLKEKGASESRVGAGRDASGARSGSDAERKDDRVHRVEKGEKGIKSRLLISRLPENQIDEQASESGTNASDQSTEPYTEVGEEANSSETKTNQRGTSIEGDEEGKEEEPTKVNSEIDWYTIFTDGKVKCDHNGCVAKLSTKRGWERHAKNVHAGFEADEVAAGRMLKEHALALKRFPEAAKEREGRVCPKCKTALSRKDAMERHHLTQICREMAKNLSGSVLDRQETEK